MFLSSREIDRKSGAVTLVGIVVLAAFFIGGFRLVGLQYKVATLVGLQFAMDQCVSKAALETENKLSQIESDNKLIKKIRRLALSSPPPVRAALIAVSAGIALRQDFSRTSWNLKAASYTCLNKRCDFPFNYWRRPSPPDSQGTYPLVWAQMPDAFEVACSSEKVGAFAQINRENNTETVEELQLSENPKEFLNLPVSVRWRSKWISKETYDRTQVKSRWSL